MSIEGNDKVDDEAKKAAKSKGIDQAIPKITATPLKSSRLQSIKQAIKTDWDTAWKSYKSTSKLLCNITVKRNVNESAKLYKSVSTRNDVTQLVRLRTGH